MSPSQMLGRSSNRDNRGPEPYSQPDDIPGNSAMSNTDVPQSLEERFTLVYEKNAWGDAETRSGLGSKADAYSVATSIEALNTLLKRFNVTTLNDIPCGDFNWMWQVLVDNRAVSYMGFDIVRPLIVKNSLMYPAYRFCQLDITSQVPPRADLTFCKDLLNHLPYKAVFAALANMKASGSTYLLVSNNFDFLPNTELEVTTPSASRHLDLMLEPFSFPVPLWRTSYLGLWMLKDIPV
jgi:hypothetical protein